MWLDGWFGEREREKELWAETLLAGRMRADTWEHLPRPHPGDTAVTGDNVTRTLPLALFHKHTHTQKEHSICSRMNNYERLPSTSAIRRKNKTPNTGIHTYGHPALHQLPFMCLRLICVLIYANHIHVAPSLLIRTVMALIIKTTDSLFKGAFLLRSARA